MGGTVPSKRPAGIAAEPVWLVPLENLCFAICFRGSRGEAARTGGVTAGLTVGSGIGAGGDFVTGGDGNGATPFV